MKKLLLAASLSLLAAGCASGRDSMGYGYILTDDGLDGCAFRYGYYPYYDPYPSGGFNPARMDIALVERLRVPRPIDRNLPWPDASPRGDGIAYSSDVYQQNERAAVSTAAPPPPTRVVEPRS